MEISKLLAVHQSAIASDSGCRSCREPITIPSANPKEDMMSWYTLASSTLVATMKKCNKYIEDNDKIQNEEQIIYMF